MAPENRTQIHNKFVTGVCNFLTRIAPPEGRFDIKENCIMGERAATVEIGEEALNYDILLIHINNRVGIHYYCECKTRKECSNSVTSDLKRQLGCFLHNAYKTVDYAHGRYGENYGFLFVSDTPFEIIDSSITLGYLREALNDINPLDEEKLAKISSRMRILILSEWFISLYGEV